jgi:hypothetical protein
VVPAPVQPAGTAPTGASSKSSATLNAPAGTLGFGAVTSGEHALIVIAAMSASTRATAGTTYLLRAYEVKDGFRSGGSTEAAYSEDSQAVGASRRAPGIDGQPGPVSCVTIATVD